jgi:hypothetical protein
MSQSSSPQQVPPVPAGNPVGVWFGRISSGLQSRWPVGHAEMQGAEGGKEQRLREGSMAMDAPPGRRSATICRSTATMTENTVYLLLDRFAPS